MAPTLSLTALELATDRVVGVRPGASDAGPSSASPLDALLDLVRPAVARPPCVVTFSGGRDSSVLLAACAHVARTEGLPDPVAATLLFPDLPEAEESTWQRQVIDHIGIVDWERTPVTDQLDILGERSKRLLRRHGVLWPHNVNLHHLLAEVAKDGSLVMGIHGDRVFGGTRWNRANNTLARRHPPGWKDLAHVALASSPAPLKRRVLRRGIRRLPWLTEEAARSHRAAMTAAGAGVPVRHDRRLRRLASARSLAVAASSLELVATDANAIPCAPFGHRDFLAALAAASGPRGFEDRTALMESEFHALLPAAVLRRETKARFASAFLSEPTHEFLREWDGTGLDESIIDTEALQREWRQDVVDARSLLLAQQVWLVHHQASDNR